MVGGDRDLGDVVEEVVEQDLRRQHRQERQEQRRTGHAEHVAEVRARPHQEVLEDIPEGLPPGDDPGVQHVEPSLEQDDVRGLARYVDRARDGDADVRAVERRRIVDSVAEEADDVPALT